MSQVRIAGLVLLAFLSSVANAQATGIVKEIVVRGNTKINRDVILTYMRTKIGGMFSQSALDDDRKTILDGIGVFSDVRFSTNLLADNNWRVIVDVSEFAEVKEIEIVGNKAVPTEAILKVVTPIIELNKLFNLRDQSRVRDAIRDLYKKKGSEVNFNDIRPSKENPNTVRIELVEQIVGQIIVEGATVTQPRVFERLIRMRPGDPLQIDAIRADGRRIANTQWFSKYEPLISDGKVRDITWQVTEQRTGQFNGGVTLDPQNQLAGVIGITENNFRGTGQSVGFNYLQGTQGAGGSLSLDYTNPFYDAKDTTVRLSLYDRVNFRFQNTLGSNNTSSLGTSNRYYERRTGGTFGVSRPYRVDFKDVYSFGTSLRSERINTTANIVDPSQPLPTNFIQQDGEIGALAFTGIVNNRDFDQDPSRGTYLRLDQELGYAIIEPSSASTINGPTGRSNFLRTSFDYRTYYSKEKPRLRSSDPNPTVYAFRVRGGTISGQVPFFEQYFAGGNDSIRGYQEDRFWGTNLLVTSFEYRRPIDRFSDNGFSVVAFVDWGSAWGGYGSINDFVQNDKFKASIGYGLGIRLRTPLGPIRLDFGFNGEGGSRPHFMIGPSF